MSNLASCFSFGHCANMRSQGPSQRQACHGWSATEIRKGLCCSHSALSGKQLLRLLMGVRRASNCTIIRYTCLFGSHQQLEKVASLCGHCANMRSQGPSQRQASHGWSATEVRKVAVLFALCPQREATFQLADGCQEYLQDLFAKVQSQSRRLHAAQSLHSHTACCVCIPRFQSHFWISASIA